MKRRPVSLLLTGGALLILLLLSPAMPLNGDARLGHAAEPHRHVIVDTDMGLDDVRAVLALLADSTLVIDAFVTVEGSASLGKATDNLIGLLEASRSSSIPVIRGNDRPWLAPPPWRETANSLGGAAFPPPRKTAVADFTPAGLADVLDRTPDVHYVALGPLSNLETLEKGDPAGIGHISTIWIPAVVRGGRISDWNLLYDADASRTVFDSAARIVIIDLSEAEEIDGPGFLASLDGDSFAVLWMERLLDGLGTRTAHVMLYDDLAAAAFLRQDLLEFDGQTYSARWTVEDGFDLAPAPGGNVRVARLRDRQNALATLERLYSKGPMDRHSRGHTHDVPVEPLLRTFHGHLGPYVVIGYRMGKLALRELDSEGHFGISAEVHSPRRPPRSCLIDGVQIGSGCTLGKGNITVEEAPEPAWAVFTSAGGERVTVRLRAGIPALVEELVNTAGVEAAGRAFFEVEIDSLFEVDRQAR